jgi:hypothetical protein
MKAGFRQGFFVLFFISTPWFIYGQEQGSAIKLKPGILIGYNRGFGIQTNLTAYNFSKDFPFELRAGIGYTALNPGNAADVRRIYINNATNGVPEKKGRSYDFRLDFLINTSVFNLNHACFVIGPRFSTYKGDFKYVGGNEDFEIKSKQWGLGGGLESHLTMTRKLNLIIALGLDYYFPSTLTGHDTSYSPDNDNVNAQNDNQNGDVPFTYKEANKATNQPALMPRAMIGIEFNL